MNAMKNRILIVVVALVVIAALLACSTESLISRTQPTATPTKTPKPTFTVTLTPTNTPIPTDTPTPTATFTPTPEATNTPIILTATPTDTPLPTDTPSPTSPPPTNTPRPKPKPTKKPVPTNTPKPAGPTNTPVPQFAWVGGVDFTAVNCGLTRVFGHTLTKTGTLAAGIWVHYWADGWTGAWDQSLSTDFGTGTAWKGDEGNWDGTINNMPIDATWRVCVVDKENSTNCISNIVSATTSSNCHAGTQSPQVIHVTFKQQ